MPSFDHPAGCACDRCSLPEGRAWCACGDRTIDPRIETRCSACVSLDAAPPLCDACGQLAPEPPLCERCFRGAETEVRLMIRFSQGRE